MESKRQKFLIFLILITLFCGLIFPLKVTSALSIEGIGTIIKLLTDIHDWNEQIKNFSENLKDPLKFIKEAGVSLIQSSNLSPSAKVFATDLLNNLQDLSLKTIINKALQDEKLINDVLIKNIDEAKMPDFMKDLLKAGVRAARKGSEGLSTTEILEVLKESKDEDAREFARRVSDFIENYSKDKPKHTKEFLEKIGLEILKKIGDKEQIGYKGSTIEDRLENIDDIASQILSEKINLQEPIDLIMKYITDYGGDINDIYLQSCSDFDFFLEDLSQEQKRTFCDFLKEIQGGNSESVIALEKLLDTLGLSYKEKTLIMLTVRKVKLEKIQEGIEIAIRNEYSKALAKINEIENELAQYPSFSREIKRKGEIFVQEGQRIGDRNLIAEGKELIKIAKNIDKLNKNKNADLSERILQAFKQVNQLANINTINRDEELHNLVDSQKKKLIANIWELKKAYRTVEKLKPMLVAQTTPQPGYFFIGPKISGEEEYWYLVYKYDKTELFYKPKPPELPVPESLPNLPPEFFNQWAEKPSKEYFVITLGDGSRYIAQSFKSRLPKGELERKIRDHPQLKDKIVNSSEISNVMPLVLESPQPNLIVEAPLEAAKTEIKSLSDLEEECGNIAPGIPDFACHLRNFVIQIINLVGYAVYQLFVYLNRVFGYIIGYLATVAPFDEEGGEPAPAAALWITLRSLAFIIIIFAGLLAAFEYILGQDANAFRSIFQIIIISFLIFFSYAIIKEFYFVVDNIGKGLIGGKDVEGQVGSAINGIYESIDIRNKLAQALNAGPQDAFSWRVLVALSINVVAIAFMIALFLLLLVLVGIFLFRYIFIAFLTGFAPFALSLRVFPRLPRPFEQISASLQGFFDFWARNLISWITIAPLLILFLVLCASFSNTFLTQMHKEIPAKGFIKSVSDVFLSSGLVLGCNVLAISFAMKISGVIGVFFVGLGTGFLTWVGVTTSRPLFGYISWKAKSAAGKLSKKLGGAMMSSSFRLIGRGGASLYEKGEELEKTAIPETDIKRDQKILENLAQRYKETKDPKYLDQIASFLTGAKGNPYYLSQLLEKVSLPDLLKNETFRKKFLLKDAKLPDTVKNILSGKIKGLEDKNIRSLVEGIINLQLDQLDSAIYSAINERLKGLLESASNNKLSEAARALSKIGIPFADNSKLFSDLLSQIPNLQQSIPSILFEAFEVNPGLLSTSAQSNESNIQFLKQIFQNIEQNFPSRYQQFVQKLTSEQNRALNYILR